MHDAPGGDLERFLPPEIRSLKYSQALIPAIAKDRLLMAAVEGAVRRIPTRHDLYCTDAREMGFLPDGSVQLVVTSPPYWTLEAGVLALVAEAWRGGALEVARRAGERSTSEGAVPHPRVARIGDLRDGPATVLLDGQAGASLSRAS